MRADLGLTDAEAALFGRLPPAHIANLHRDALRFIDNAATLYVHIIIMIIIMGLSLRAIVLPPHRIYLRSIRS